VGRVLARRQRPDRAIRGRADVARVIPVLHHLGHVVRQIADPLRCVSQGETAGGERRVRVTDRVVHGFTVGGGVAPTVGHVASLAAGGVLPLGPGACLGNHSWTRCRTRCLDEVPGRGAWHLAQPEPRATRSRRSRASTCVRGRGGPPNLGGTAELLGSGRPRKRAAPPEGDPGSVARPRRHNNGRRYTGRSKAHSSGCLPAQSPQISQEGGCHVDTL